MLIFMSPSLPKFVALVTDAPITISFPSSLSRYPVNATAFRRAVHLIFQLLWVNRDEQAIALRLSDHLIWSWAKFQRLRHIHQGHGLQKSLGAGEASRMGPLWRRAVSAGTSLPRSDFTVQKDMFPSPSEGCPHLFQFWASTHQPLSISISRLEIYLESRQVLVGGLMTTDLWILSRISIIGDRVITGGCSQLSSSCCLQQSLKAS